VLEIDNKIEDMQYDIEEDQTAASVQTGSDGDEASEVGGFMSESMYGKLPSPKNQKRRVAHSRLFFGPEVEA